jgi:hypothetical protein
MKNLKRVVFGLSMLFFSISAMGVPTTPGSIKVTGVTHVSAKLDWNASIVIGETDQITYEVKMRTRNKEGKPSEWAFHGGCCLVENNSVVVDGLLPETTYEVRVVAYDEQGNNSKARIKENAFKTLQKPTVYQEIKSIPIGFSMMSIPFKFGDNSVLSIFGDLEFFNKDLTIYKYTAENGFVVNSYDSDFGWDDELMKLEPGEAIWILNESINIRHRAFRGNVSDKWRELP